MSYEFILMKSCQSRKNFFFGQTRIERLRIIIINLGTPRFQEFRRSSMKPRNIILSMFMVLLSAPLGWAQSTTGTITGTVTDPTGAGHDIVERSFCAGGSDGLGEHDRPVASLVDQRRGRA